MDKVQSACDAINEKRGLETYQVGSLMHLSDMATNAVIQFANKSGGYYTLATGDDKSLVNYLTENF